MDLNGNWFLVEILLNPCPPIQIQGRELYLCDWTLACIWIFGMIVEIANIYSLVLVWMILIFI